jgi:hypothetical protein
MPPPSDPNTRPVTRKPASATPARAEWHGRFAHGIVSECRLREIGGTSVGLRQATILAVLRPAKVAQASQPASPSIGRHASRRPASSFALALV